MKGSVFKSGNSWMYQIDIGRDENGKRMRQSRRFATKEEAEYQLQLAIETYLRDGKFMKKMNLELERTVRGTYRCIFINNHGRLIYLELNPVGDNWEIIECFYTDRNRGKIGQERKKSVPLKQVTKTVKRDGDELLLMIARELDKLFFGIDFIESPDTMHLNCEEYADLYDTVKEKYYFLIFVGEGEVVCDKLTTSLKTRFKNKIHRSVYIELEYIGNGKGIVKECYFYDKAFEKKGRKVSPPKWRSMYIDYTREAIINLFNSELDGYFTDILVISDGTLDVKNKTVPVCGSL